MKRPKIVRQPSLAERLWRVLRPQPEFSGPTPGSEPRSVPVPPEGTPLPPPAPAPIRTREEAMAPWNQPLTSNERIIRSAPDVARIVGLGMGPAALAIYNRRQGVSRGPTPGSAPQRFDLPVAPSAPPTPAPLPIASPEIIELVRAVHRGDISLEQAEEFAREANRSETLDKSGVSALLRAAQERRSQNG